MKILFSVALITISISASAQNKTNSVSKSLSPCKDSSIVYKLNADGSIEGYNKENGKIVNAKLFGNNDKMPIAKPDSATEYKLRVIDTDTAKISQ